MSGTTIYGVVTAPTLSSAALIGAQQTNLQNRLNNLLPAQITNLQTTLAAIPVSAQPVQPANPAPTT